VLPLAEQVGGSLPPDAKDVLSSLDSFVLRGKGEGDVTQLQGFLRLND
jgi:hypothetical protein